MLAILKKLTRANTKKDAQMIPTNFLVVKTHVAFNGMKAGHSPSTLKVMISVTSVTKKPSASDLRGRFHRSELICS